MRPGVVLVPFLLGLSSCGNYPWESYYFARLCEREGGIRVARSVDGVESVLQMRLPEDIATRPRPALYAPDGKWAGHKPYWSYETDAWVKQYPKNFLVTDPHQKASFKDYEKLPATKYAFFEAPAAGHRDQSSKFVRLTSEIVLVKPCASYFCYAESEARETSVPIETPQSRYGFKWEDIHPDWFADRIIGKRYSIVNLKTGEVLATAQDFILFARNVSERSGGPQICRKPDGSYESPTMSRFVLGVLRPRELAPRKRIYESQP